MRRILLVVISSLGLLGAVPALAANPHSPGTTGQPNKSCEELPTGPAGFDTGGFSHAQSMYAGAGMSADHANSDAAVSQYDVACFQLSQ